MNNFLLTLLAYPTNTACTPVSFSALIGWLQLSAATFSAGMAIQRYKQDDTYSFLKYVLHMLHQSVIFNNLESLKKPPHACVYVRASTEMSISVFFRETKAFDALITFNKKMQ